VPSPLAKAINAAAGLSEESGVQGETKLVIESDRESDKCGENFIVPITSTENCGGPGSENATKTLPTYSKIPSSCAKHSKCRGRLRLGSVRVARQRN